MKGFVEDRLEQFCSSQGHNLALTVLYVPSFLDSGPPRILRCSDLCWLSHLDSVGISPGTALGLPRDYWWLIQQEFVTIFVGSLFLFGRQRIPWILTKRLFTKFLCRPLWGSTRPHATRELSVSVCPIGRCRPNIAPIRQSRPNLGPGFLV